MDAPVSVPVPLLGPGGPGSRLAATHAPDGPHVRCGQPQVTLEASDSVLRVEAAAADCVAGLSDRVGDLLRLGDRLCWLAAERN
jgi:hypothetical protein